MNGPIPTMLLILSAVACSNPRPRMRAAPEELRQAPVPRRISPRQGSPRSGLFPETGRPVHDENDYHHHLEDEGPALVKLIHHELVQFVRRLQLVVDQPA